MGLHEDRAREDRKKEQWTNKRRVENSKEKEKSKERTESKPTNETSNRVVQDMNRTYTSIVIPVWLFTTRNPENEVLMNFWTTKVTPPWSCKKKRQKLWKLRSLCS